MIKQNTYLDSKLKLVLNFMDNAKCLPYECEEDWEDYLSHDISNEDYQYMESITIDPVETLQALYDYSKEFRDRLDGYLNLHLIEQLKNNGKKIPIDLLNLKKIAYDLNCQIDNALSSMDLNDLEKIAQIQYQLESEIKRITDLIKHNQKKRIKS